MIPELSIFLYGFPFDKEDYLKLNKKVNSLFFKLDRSSDLDAQKSLNWARSGQPELPEK